jgi:hypothetical protein
MAKIILITGDREWPYEEFAEIYDRLDLERPVDVLVAGGARGVDTICEEWTVVSGVKVDRYPADWDNPEYRTKTGKSFAGNIRNQQMLDETLEKYGKYPDKCIAFHRNFAKSRGTKDMVGKARKVGVKVEFYPTS